MTDEEIFKLEGHIFATQAAMRALILSFPDPAAAARRVVLEINKLAAAALPTTLPDELVAGIDEAKSRILPSPSDLRGRR